MNWGFPGGAVVKNLPANAGETRDVVLIPEWGRSPGEVNGNSLQYSCLENSMDRGAWWATVHRVAKSDWTCTHMNYCQNILNVHKVQFLSYLPAKVYKQKLQYFLSKLLGSFYSLLPPCRQLEYSLRVHSSCQQRGQSDNIGATITGTNTPGFKRMGISNKHYFLWKKRCIY